MWDRGQEKKTRLLWDCIAMLAVLVIMPALMESKAVWNIHGFLAPRRRCVSGGMRKKRILLIEDEVDLAELTAMRLQREQYEVEVARDGPEGLDKALAQAPDLVLLDIMLPGVSGMDVLAELKKNSLTAYVPVIMLTARTEECDIVAGLRLGADDYITKPFSHAVLLARIVAILRRAVLHKEGIGEGILTAGPIVVDRASHQVKVSNRPLALTLTEFRLLVFIIRSEGRVLTRDQLIDEALGQDAMVAERTVDVHISSLRRKLGRARKYIDTVHGLGYRLAVGA